MADGAEVILVDHQITSNTTPASSATIRSELVELHACRSTLSHIGLELLPLVPGHSPAPSLDFALTRQSR
jgi:hypothetical protein